MDIDWGDLQPWNVVILATFNLFTNDGCLMPEMYCSNY